MFKVLAKMFIVIAAMAFTFFLLMRFAPSTNHAIIHATEAPGVWLTWCNVIIAGIGLITFKMVK